MLRADSTGWGCVFLVVYVVLSEIFPTGVRGKAVSVVSAVNWATNLLISMTFLSITGNRLVCVGDRKSVV